MGLLKGIIHAHSNYSYDGQHSLAEIAKYGIKRGYGFIGMSEHSDTLDEKKMADYVKECQQVSSQNCLIISGIEFTCEDNLHIVGLGVEHYTDIKDPLKVAEFIRQQGGISIIAHPVRYNYQIPSNLSNAVDGIEVWNAGYDGRFVPNDCSLNLIKEMRKENKSILAFGGQDLHRIKDHCSVEIAAPCNGLSKGSILLALKEGNFVISNPYFELDSSREPGWLKLGKIRLSRRMYYLTKWLRDHFI